MVKSRAVQAKASRTWGIEEHSSSQAGSVVMPDPVCGSRGAKTANSNLRCRSQGRDSPVSNGRTSTTRGNFAPSPSAAGVSKFSRDVIRGPLKELSESELNTGIVHVGFSSRKAASVTRPSTSAKARQSIAEAQSYEWGQQNVMAGSSPSSENTFSVQHAMDLAQQAVDAFKTPPGKALSARQGQGSPGSSIGGSARSIKFSMHDVMTPGITGKLSHRIDTLFHVVNHSESTDCPMTPYVLSSCSCATAGAERCSLHGPRASSVKSGRSRPRSSIRGTSTPGFKDMKDAMSPVPESTSMLSMSQGCIISPDCSMQLTPPQQSASSSSSHKSLKAGAVEQVAKRQNTSRVRTTDVDQVEAGVGEGVVLDEEGALAGKKPVRDIIVLVKPEWREDNGFQVWEVVERNASGEPLRGVELLPLQLLGSQSYGSFSFASTNTSRKRSLTASKDARGESGFHAPADFREVEVTIGKRKYQVVKLTKEQKQVTKLHEELSKRQKPGRKSLS